MEDRLYFPLFFDLSEKTVLVVGGGKIAARRVKTLLPFAGHIRVAAPACTDELRALAGEGAVIWRKRPFAPEDLNGAAIVLCATGDETVDTEVWRLCRERGIPVNIASDKEKCDFYFPGIARKDNVVAGVTAGGTDHKKARETTERIRSLLEED